MAEVMDIFEGWKLSKFVVGPVGMFGCSHVIVLTDIEYWNNNYDELAIWCDDNNCVQQGMTVDIPTDETLTLFCLKWA